jgi:hypothetical protein
MEPCLALLLLLVRLAFLLFAVTFCKQHKRERFSRSTTGHELFAGSDRCRAGPHTHTCIRTHTHPQACLKTITCLVRMAQDLLALLASPHLTPPGSRTVALEPWLFAAQWRGPASGGIARSRLAVAREAAIGHRRQGQESRSSARGRIPPTLSAKQG